MKKNKYLTVDVGGTKIKFCKFDENFQLTNSAEIPTNKLPVNSLDFIVELKKYIKQHLEPGVKKIGISFKAAVNDGVIVYSTLLGGSVNYELEKEFKKEFGVTVKLENDVNAMAIAENKIGKGVGIHSFVLLNIGTGLKLSYINNNQLVYGYTGNAGEIAQKEVIVPELDNQVIKIDYLVSGQGIENIYSEFSGQVKSAKEIFSNKEDDINAQKSVKIFNKYFIQLLVELSYYYNPEKIIINGSVKKSLKPHLVHLVNEYQKSTMDIFHSKSVEISEMDNCAGLGCILQ